MKKTIDTLSFLFFLFFLCKVSFAQEAARVINFSKKQYQAQNQNWAITQCADYNIYFGNASGLLCYNGTVWTSYVLPNRQIIRSVACDGQGRIFTGAFGEFGYWEKNKKGQLIYHSIVDKVKHNLAKKEEIWNIIVRDSFVFFQSFSTIYKYNYQNIQVIKPPGNIMFLHRVNQRLLLQVIDKGLFDLAADGSFKFIAGSEFFKDKVVATIIPLDSKSFLVGTATHGVFKYQNKQFFVWNQQFNDVFKTWQLNKAIALSNGQFAFGTILNGLYILNDLGEILMHINQQNGLQNNTILSLYEDKKQNLWLGLDKGIDHVELNSPLSFFKDKLGKIGTVYTAALFDGFLYVGTNQGVFYKNWNKPSILSHDTGFQLIKGTQGQVWELKIFDNQLLCGHNEGSFLIQKNHIKKIADITGGWVTIPHPKYENVLLQGTYTGLIVFRKNAHGEWIFSNRINGFLEPVRKMIFDAHHHLWVANPNKGLHRLQLDEELKNIIQQDDLGLEDGLTTEFKLDLEKLNDTIFIQSPNNLFSFDEMLNKIQPKSSFNGFALSNHPSKIKKGRGRDWFEIYPNQLVYHSFSTSWNFPLALVPDYECIVALDSTSYLFGLDDGYAIFEKKRKKVFDNKQNPPPKIISVEVFDKKYQPVPIAIEKDIQLECVQNNLRFRFTQTLFTRRLLFSYRLLGLDEEWAVWSSRSFKEYSNLKSGKYTFQVKSNASNKIANISFTILPHWYQTWWSFLLYFFVLAIIALLLYKWHHRRLEKQHQKLKAESERQLEKQRIKSANERLHADILNKTKELANSTINLARKNEILLQIKEELKLLQKKQATQNLSNAYQRLFNIIDRNLTSEQDHELFKKNFNQIHDSFFKKLKADFPNLTPGDLQLAAYLKMNLSSKEIAPLLHISVRGVENKRYRLRKKMGLDTDGNLTEIMMLY